MTVYFSCLLFVNFKNTTLFVGALNLFILQFWCIRSCVKDSLFRQLYASESVKC